jgi:hypothetical protein
MRKLSEYAWDGTRLQVGGWFRICCNRPASKDDPNSGFRHFAHGETFQARRIIPSVKARGNDVDPIDLGTMVEFRIEDHYGQPADHLIPIEWAIPCPRPSVAGRVKRARFPKQEALPLERADHG